MLANSLFAGFRVHWLHQERGIELPDEEEWRILAEEAAQEQDPKKLIEIVNSLTAALDERLTTKAAGQQTNRLNKANGGRSSKETQKRA
jgi:hypothetical protein